MLTLQFTIFLIIVMYCSMHVKYYSTRTCLIFLINFQFHTNVFRRKIEIYNFIHTKRTLNNSYALPGVILYNFTQLPDYISGTYKKVNLEVQLRRITIYCKINTDDNFLLLQLQLYFLSKKNCPVNTCVKINNRKDILKLFLAFADV